MIDLHFFIFFILISIRLFQFYSDPNLCERFFGNKQTLLVFFDLLYKQHEYTVFLKHFRELLERLESKQQQITRSLYVLAFAVCYRQVPNTHQICIFFFG